MRSASAILPLVLLHATAASAHQPVMDMAPRWKEGFGVQLRHEWRSSEKLLSGEDEISNPLGRRRRVSTTWLEGVYTFRREVRVTLKVPWVEQTRVSSIGGVSTRQTGSGVGDIILAVPLRKYVNLDKATMNFGITPNLRFPTGGTGDSYPVGDGSWDPGLGLSFSAENPRYYLLADLFYWKNTNGKRGIDPGDLLGLDVNLGVHPLHSNTYDAGAFVMLDIEARYEERGQDTGGITGGKRVSVGPILVGYWRNFMLRGELKIPAYEDVRGSQVSRGTQFNLGLGAAF